MSIMISRGLTMYALLCSSRVVPNNVNHVLCAFVEYPVSALLSREHEHGVKERRGGGIRGRGGGVALHLSDLVDATRNVTLYSYQVDI
jgi:hypothetical protein